MNIRYYLSPEDSTLMMDQGIDFSFKINGREALKTALWIGIAFILAASMSGLN